MKRWLRVIVGLGVGGWLALMSVAPPVPAYASGTLMVDDDKVQCPKAGFTTISAAVAAALPGNVIKVCAGTYTEQVHIDHLDKLKLIAMKGVTLHPPAAFNGAMILVTNSYRVTIQGFTIDGDEQFASGGGQIRGIEFQGSSGTIQKNTVTRIRETPLGIDGTLGQAIWVHFGPNGPVSIKNNVVSDYQSVGIDVAGGILAPQIDHNTITSDASQNTDPVGIALSHTPGGKVTGNIITSNWSSANDLWVDGILVYETFYAHLSGNKVYSQTAGIRLLSLCDFPGGVADYNKVTGNQVWFSNVGILLDAELPVNLDGTPKFAVCNPHVDFNSVSGNKMYAPAAFSGTWWPAPIELYAAAPNSTSPIYDPYVMGNKVSGNKSTGYGSYAGVLCDSYATCFLNNIITHNSLASLQPSGSSVPRPDVLNLLAKLGQ